MVKYTVEGYWDCPFCRTKEIKGRVQKCPSCGKQRGKETKFYLKEFSEEYSIDHQTKGPDWFCPFCHNYNSAELDSCSSCGANKSESNKDYFDFNPDQEGTKPPEENFKIMSYSFRDSKNSPRETYKDTYRNTFRDTAGDTEEEVRGDTEEEVHKDTSKDIMRAITRFVSKHRIKFLGIFGLLFAFYFILKMFGPKEIIVKDKSWARKISIESYETVKESNWVLPSKGRLIETKNEIHHYDRVFSHTETKTRRVPHRVFDGYDEYTTTRNNGDGTFGVETHRTPRYRTEYRTETYSKPVYRSVPRYQNKYYCNIERWKHKRTVESSGMGDKPYWADYKLANGKETKLQDRSITTGQERLGDKREACYLTDLDNNKYSIDCRDWQAIKEETKIKVKKLLGNKVELVKD